jgi:hypothetical protein
MLSLSLWQLFSAVTLALFVAALCGDRVLNRKDKP